MEPKSATCGESVTASGHDGAMLRRIALAWSAAAAVALIAGCHHHGPGSHSHGPDGEEVAWSEGVRQDSRPTDGPAEGGRRTGWWGLYEGKTNVGTRRITRTNNRGDFWDRMSGAG